MIGLFYLSSLAFMYSCIMLFDLFSWTAFFCYLWSASLLTMVGVAMQLFHNWYQARKLEKWLKEGEADDDE